MRIPRDSLVMAVDGAHCVVFRNDGNAAAPSLVLIEAAHRVAGETVDLRTDFPGRQVEAGGDDGSIRPARDGAGNILAQGRFLMAAAALLDDLAEQGAPYLFLIAPPRILGTMLSGLGNAAASALIATMEGDYAQSNGHEIAEMLARRP